VLNFGFMVDKWIFTASVLGRMTARIFLVTILGMVLVNVSLYLRGEPLQYFNTLGIVLQDKFYQLFLIAAVIFNTRHILFRLMDRDSN